MKSAKPAPTASVPAQPEVDPEFLGRLKAYAVSCEMHAEFVDETFPGEGKSAARHLAEDMARAVKLLEER